MTKKIALLRGVNVGGHNKLPMKELAALLGDIGCKNIRTYIQSGNVVYDGAADGKAIAAAIAERFGFESQTFVLSAAGLKTAATACPYREPAKANPKAVHLTFLDGKPAKDAAAQFCEIKTAPEEFVIKTGVLYLHSPKGLSESKIAASADRILKVKTTSRNWNTIEALIKLADETA